ncbi:MAG TPA: hypothetical protein VJW94_18225 [Candidatus Acidoferrum sp.]|nr:hypothetical protein [Candidatus Acidoferrum sp.]
MTLEQQKVYVEYLTDLMVIHFNQINSLQLSIGKALAEVGEAYGPAATVPLLDDAMKKLKAATLHALPVDFLFKM